MDPISMAIAGGLQLAGGFMGKSSQDEANRISQENAERNIRLQKEFATNAIQWKVADAAAAGVHPLYALGASTTSFSPVSVGVSGSNPVGEALSSMGQNVARAAAATRGPTARANAVGEVAQAQEIKFNNLKLENMELQNAALRSKLVTMNQPGTPPGVEFPVPEKDKPEERPPLMIFGKRWDTNPNTSPMKAWEDQYGDDGPASWILPPVIGANDAVFNSIAALKKSGLSRWWLETQRALQQRGSWSGRR